MYGLTVVGLADDDDRRKYFILKWAESAGRTKANHETYHDAHQVQLIGPDEPSELSVDVFAAVAACSIDWQWANASETALVFVEIKVSHEEVDTWQMTDTSGLDSDERETGWMCWRVVVHLSDIGKKAQLCHEKKQRFIDKRAIDYTVGSIKTRKAYILPMAFHGGSNEPSLPLTAIIGTDAINRTHS